MPVVGFDFGTTNSLISIIMGNKPINFLDRGLPIPSVVCYEGAGIIVGKQARDRLAGAGLGIQGSVVRSPKVLLGKESVTVEGVERSPVDIVADVVRFVKAQAEDNRQVPGLTIDKAVVTIPVNMDGHRRSELRDAFLAAGISIFQFIHEPLAALYGYLRSQPDYDAALRKYEGKLILVFDWGGGTLDLTLCRLRDGRLVQIANDGTDEVGGDLFDDTIRSQIETNERIKRNLGSDTLPEPGAETRFRDRCERAKIELSDRDSALVYLPSFFRGIESGDIDYRLTRDDLEKMTASLLNKGIGRINALLDKAGYSAAQVELCLATGGMVNMPVVKSRLHEIFGPAKVEVSERSSTLISEGAAWVAHDNAKLHLARNVELLLARNSYVVLLPAGTKMPVEGEVKKEPFSLYCADPTDGFAKFSLQSPIRPVATVAPTERREPLGNLVVAVDAKAKPLFERLNLEVSIDDNLVLRAVANSLNKGAKGYAEIVNLEFGLSMPESIAETAKVNKDSPLESSATVHQKGDLVIRSNIANAQDEASVPGEVLYKFSPGSFDTRGTADETQRDEKLYYGPCSICGRPSNDPLCLCDQGLKRANK